MLIKFSNFANNREILVPINRVFYIQDREDGGCNIHTDIPTEDPNKCKSFRSRESAKEIHRENKVTSPLQAGIFSSV